MTLTFPELLSLILVASVLVQSAMLYHSVPRATWDSFLESGERAAKQTEGKVDDAIIAGAKQVTPFLDKLGFFKQDPTTTVSTPSDDKMSNDLSSAG